MDQHNNFDPLLSENSEQRILELQKNIVSRADFELFLKELTINFRDSKSNWDNSTLETFLEGLYGYNYECGNESPTWILMAEMLLAARVYE